MMNYHELTMGQPRDSPQQRKQFLVICTVMASVFVHTMMSSGGFSTVEINPKGIFPGGDYIFKLAARDYAASDSLIETICKDATGKTPSQTETADLYFKLFLDDVSTLGGHQTRFASGLLTTTESAKVLYDDLVKKNETIVPVLSAREAKELAITDLWKRLPYQTADLPSVNAAVVQFPYTAGFVSALVFSYKILPALRDYALQNVQPKGAPVVILSTCSQKQEMCTHYAPLAETQQFLLGQPDYEQYLSKIQLEPMFDWEQVNASLQFMFPFLKYFQKKLE